MIRVSYHNSTWKSNANFKARSLGTAKVFLETLNIPCEDIRISRQAKDTDVTDATYQVWDLMRRSSDYGGNYWVLDPAFQDDLLSSEGERLAEGRKSVNKRVERILRYYGNFVKKLEQKTGQRICLLLFTHWEIILPFLQGIHPHDSDFPIERAECPKHAEAVIIELDNPKNHAYTIYARGEKSKVSYDETA